MQEVVAIQLDSAWAGSSQAPPDTRLQTPRGTRPDSWVWQRDRQLSGLPKHQSGVNQAPSKQAPVKQQSGA